ncbi:MAG: homocysteine S-methyltransferase family protein [Chitinispirillales bacterium]|jgi:5-methyltetrahydrofolate--homocysteine methyltransferase|nr:homocysteine S-methyltransferase family protein [Chitinispirillales bacterium]
MNMKHPFLEMINNREPVIFDGALGTEILKAAPSEEDYGGYAGCNEYLNISRPDIIEAILVKYLEAGANVVETNTFGGSRIKLGEFGLGGRVHEINKAAAMVAREAIKKAGGDKPRFVCGSIGPTGFLPSSSDKELSAVTFDRLVDIYKEQAAGLLDGGADLLIIETSQDLLEVRAAIYGIRKLTKSMDRYIPLQVQATMDSGGKMLLGSDVSAFLGAVQAMGVDVVGLNCGSGPDEMAPWIDELLTLSILPISVLPNAGLPHNVDGKAVYKMSPEEFAKKTRAFVAEKGVAVIGGCCGTTPEHIRVLTETLVGVKTGKRQLRHREQSETTYPQDNSRCQATDCSASLAMTGTLPYRACFLSTGISGLDLEQLPKPIIIGERLNTQGSKKTKEHVINRNFDELYHIAKEQVDHNSSLIDICVAANELDVSEDVMMGDVVKFLSDRINVPLCIDTTEPKVLEAALNKSPGSVLINSINLEHDGEKARKILPLAVDFGCPVIALTIDNIGMAATAERKLEITAALRKLACDEYGLPEHYLYIDPLVFTLSTGDTAAASAALESLEALRRIKKVFPNIRTAMGVSNVSFGLKPKARRILNNLMLRYAAEAGLDAAIFNPLHIDDINKYDSKIRELADDLLLNRRNDSLHRFVEHFESLSVSSPPQSKTFAGADVVQSPELRLRSAVLNRDKRNLADIINELLADRLASDILNTILLPAMSEVGDKMAAGEMILPFVLQAAEVMKEAVSILEPHLKDGDSAAKGKIVIATVYGDVHDIGKNLVASILRNQGFDVIDLGKQVALDTVVSAVQREKPDIVGLSALLVTTSQEMGKCVKEFARLAIDIPVVIGGAAVNKAFASRISILDDGSRYTGGVHYAKDAFDVVKILDEVNNKNSASDKKESPLDKKELTSKSAHRPKLNSAATRRELKYDYFIEPPFYGTGDILIWDAESLLAAIDNEFLFKAWWGGGKLAPDDYASARKEEFEPVLNRLSAKIVEEALLDARAFYGFFPVISIDEKLVFLDPSDNRTELLSFTFPRSEKSGMSLADYIRPEGDIIATQAVTIGAKLGDRCRELLLNQDRYSDGYYLNSLGSYLTEALADKASGEIRRALGLPRDGGRRYSFGYRGMPDLTEQARLIEFLGVEERLGITLTEGFQMQPEHSTVAIFVSHPEAEYLY